MSSKMALAPLLAGLLLASAPHVATAQETAADLASDEQTPVVTAEAATQTSVNDAHPTEQNASTQPATPKPWSFALAAGASNRDQGSDGSWQSLALTRQIGRGYVRGALMRYHGTLLQANTALPSDYLVGTIGAGGNFDNWVVDGWASYGRQDYGRISTDAGSRDSTGASGSDYYSIGGDFGRVIPLGPRWFATPTATVAYAHGRLLHPAPDGTGLVDLETEEPTWSSAATLRLDHAFGRDANQYVGLSLARAWTSNALSEVIVRNFHDVEYAARTGLLPARHISDAWWEIGATANMRITDSLGIDLYATRSFDALAGNTTSAGISLRRSF
jgi:hypothetical protein